MNQLQPLLEKIGLNPHESRIYLYLIDKGELPASAISKSMKIPRSTVRGSLDKLCEQGVLKKLFKRNTQYYHCKPPEVLVELLEKKIQKTNETLNEVKQSIPMFSALYQNKAVVPKVQLFEGVDQVIEAFNKTLYTEGVEEILVLTSFGFLKHPKLREHDDNFYIPMRVKKGIRLKSLSGHTDIQEKCGRGDGGELRECRYFPDEYRFPGTFYIFGDFVLYFTVNEGEYIAIIIESKLMSQTMKSVYEFMWKQCEAK